MARNVYEAMFILDSNRFGRDPDGISGELAELIQKAGGEILVSRLWEDRRLAYPIKGQRKGTYWLMYVSLEGRQLAGLRRQLEITESILRFLLLKIDPRIVDALVAHAQSAPAPAAARPRKRRSRSQRPRSEWPRRPRRCGRGKGIIAGSSFGVRRLIAAFGRFAAFESRQKAAKTVSCSKLERPRFAARS